MATVKISNLPAAAAATSIDVVPIVQGGTTKKLTFGAFLTSPTLFGSGVSTFLASPSSGNLNAALTNKTGSGLVVFDTGATMSSPTLNSPTATTPTVSSGNLTFSGTAQRIVGDMSNATFANRLAFQTTTTNGNSGLLILPNGTGTTSSIQAFNNSDPTNASVGILGPAGSTDVRIQSSIQGTGTYLPMTFYTGGSERIRVDTSGNVAVGTTNAGTAGLSLSQGFNLSWEQSATESVANLFRQASSAALVMSVGYKRSATANGFASSYGSSLAKTAISMGTTAGAITFYTDTAATTAVGTDVTPTERMRIDSSGNVNIATLGARITADFSNATLTNRVAFQTNTANSTTSITALPNGSSTDSNFTVSANSNPTNASVGQLRASSSAIVVASTRTGSGTFLPLQFQTSGGVAMSIDTGINVIQGASALSTTATAGFLWITSCAGVPTGAPTAPYTDAAAMVVDTTNSRLYVRVGTTWKYATLV